MWGSRHRLALFLGRTEVNGVGLNAKGRARWRGRRAFLNLLGFNRQTMCDRRCDAQQQQDSKELHVRLFASRKLKTISGTFKLPSSHPQSVGLLSREYV